MAWLREIIGKLLPFAIGGIIVAASFVVYGDQSAVTSHGKIECEFAAEPGQSPLRLGRYTAPLEALTVVGDVYDPFENTLYDFEGESTYRIGARNVSADVRGSVFLNDSGDVIAVLLTLEDPDFGQQGASVTTLNDDGILDTANGRAYVYTDPKFKLLHPLMMSCETRNWIRPPSSPS
ncbi:hypothetical protein K3179_07745 [Qipengyuania sp. GH38]|uniref:hypothetical protein n=1 Tax=Qipengyuania intermedia TaxID=2867244 RepID=UPI001C88860B|nr:hypothetical protein [Qipengyuania intermedia]MBX7514441.1 hypothetical protein [Qipengyuania intermedia]